MVHAWLDTSQLPVEHRFEAWTELATKAHVPTIVDSSHRANFMARIDSLELGIMRLSRLSHPPLRARGTAAVRPFPDVLLLSHVTQGRMMARSPDRVLIAQAGSIVVIDPSRPSTVVNPVDMNHTVLQIETAALGLTPAQIAALSAFPMTADRSVGGLVAHILDDLLRNGDQYPPAVVVQLTSTLIDLLGTAARTPGRTETVAPASLPERSRLLHIYAFMRQRLADPGLTPQMVAAAHAISLRQLNRILEEDGQSPSDWIRRQRLGRCRRDLLDLTMASVPVAAIGSRWGFADPVTFNRAFRREFGLPPGEYRRRFGSNGAGQPDRARHLP
jgi:AraC-like DNA-binding protein